MMKKIIFILLFSIYCLASLSTGNAFGAVASTFKLPWSTSVTMGDTSVAMPFLVTNTGTENLKSVSFVINTAVYNIGAATTAPSGWSMTIAAGSVCFTNSSAPITPASTQVFNVVLTGPSAGAIANAASDQTDSLAGGSGASNSANCTGVVAPTTSDSWTRKSLAVDLSATPSSVGTGGTITLTMQVTNRSSATQNSITANPGPPAFYLYGLTNLSGAITSSTCPITVVSTADFPNSGTIRIDNEDISYTGKTATTFTGCTRGANGTTASFHPDGISVYSRTSTAAVSNSGGPTYGKSPFNLASGESSTITWTYTANSSATVYFSAAARDTTNTATSKTGNSNQVVIGSFTAVVSVSPLSVVTGQDVTVTMTVSNNGTSALGNVTPTLTTGGTATKTLASGPTPASISSLGAGQSGTFTWTYTITGTSGQTYFFSGYACTTGCASQTATSQSATGSITTYSVTVSPDTVAVGSTNVQIGWTVYNRGSRTIKQVIITFPSGWTYSSATTSAPADWTVTAGASTVQFDAGTQIPVGDSKTFYITFSAIPTVTSDTSYTFPVFIKDQINNTATMNTTVTETAYVMTLTYSPASPISADGTSKYTLTATLTKGGSPVSGVSITFTTTAGTLSAGTATTDASGIATVDLTSPCSQTNINATINATYLNAEDPKTLSPAFSGIASGTLVYVGGSLSPKSPTSIATGYAGGFTLQLMNCGTALLTISQSATNTSFAFPNDSFGLTLASYPINAGATVTIGFSGTVSSSDSLCTPTLKVDAGAGYIGPFSYNKASPGDTISDQVLIGSGTTCPTTTTIQILDWREMY